MGRHAAPRKYSFTEYAIAVSALVTAIALPILLVTVVVAQIIILNTAP